MKIIRYGDEQTNPAELHECSSITIAKEGTEAFEKKMANLKKGLDRLRALELNRRLLCHLPFQSQIRSPITQLVKKSQTLAKNTQLSPKMANNNNDEPKALEAPEETVAADLKSDYETDQGLTKHMEEKLKDKLLIGKLTKIIQTSKEY